MIWKAHITLEGPHHFCACIISQTETHDYCLATRIAEKCSFYSLRPYVQSKKTGVCDHQQKDNEFSGGQLAVSIILNKKRKGPELK